MNILRRYISGLVLSGCLVIQISFAQTSFVTETRQQKEERLAWWHNAKFGMFIHWGLYCIPAGEWKGQRMPEIGEWIMSKYRIPVSEYSALARQFNPLKFDAGSIVELAKEAGMQYLIITAKHHDGFAMYKSSDMYNVVEATPFKRDVVKELSDACHSKNMRFGFYYSQALDWHEPDAGGTELSLPLNCGTMSWGNNWDYPVQKGENFNKYLEKKVVPQLNELLSNYGTISNIWFDVPYTINRQQSERLYNMVREKQPLCIMNSRLGNGLGDYDSAGDNEIPEGNTRPVFETPATMNDTWGYKSFDHNWKSSETLIRQLVEVVSKGGNYLLNVGPNAEGLIPDESVKKLKELGAWLKVNGEAIYGTDVWKNAPEITSNTFQFYTRKGSDLYVIVFGKNVKSIEILGIEKVESVSVLGSNEKVEFKNIAGKIILQVSDKLSIGFSPKVIKLKNAL